MLPEERKKKICDTVNDRHSIKVFELSQLTGASEVTIRRDLDELSHQKRLKRTHGGAISIDLVGEAISAPELIRSHKNLVEKYNIARAAYSMIDNKDTIFADGSSTVHELIKLIASGNRRQLVIITTSLNTVSVLADSQQVKLIILAGELNYHHSHVEGHLTTEGIRNMRADKCFIGINGIDESFGLSTPRFSDAETKEAMIHSSRQSFVVADKSKFGMVYMARVNMNSDYIITDERKKNYSYDWLKDQSNVVFANENIQED